jgi:hypothetical protein
MSFKPNTPLAILPKYNKCVRCYCIIRSRSVRYAVGPHNCRFSGKRQTILHSTITAGVCTCFCARAPDGNCSSSCRGYVSTLFFTSLLILRSDFQ